MKNKRIKFAKLEKRMVYSKAYQDLNAPTLKILSYLLLQLQWVNIARTKTKPKYIIANKEEVSLLYSTFTKAPFNMCKQTITRSIDSLLAHGFIEVKKQGGRCKGHASIFAYRDEWKQWEPGQVLYKRKPFFARGFVGGPMV